jgi:peptidyl-tRNA hydrolase
LASVIAWVMTPEAPEWNSWLRGRFTKSVRRGTAGQIVAAQEFAASHVEVGDAVALGFVPASYEDMPAVISKMQVSGTEYPRSEEPWIVDFEGPSIYINSDIEMSTGKTAAQAAHGLFAWALRLSDEEREHWVALGLPVTFFEVPAKEIITLAELGSAVPIVDAGFTEIDPGTMTVVAI